MQENNSRNLVNIFDNFLAEIFFAFPPIKQFEKENITYKDVYREFVKENELVYQDKVDEESFGTISYNLNAISTPIESALEEHCVGKNPKLVYTTLNDNQDCLKDDEKDLKELNINNFISKKYDTLSESLNIPKSDLDEAVNDFWKEHTAILCLLISDFNNIKSPEISIEAQKAATDFNDNPLRFINELIQNADDCEYDTLANILEIKFKEQEHSITLSYPEKGFTYKDIISLSSIDNSNKTENYKKAISTIGEKGRGFKSIFVFFNKVKIFSAGYYFQYTNGTIFQPSVISNITEEMRTDNGTRLELTLKEEVNFESLVNAVKELYGSSDANNLFRNNSIFFTKNLSSLSLEFYYSDNTSETIKITNQHNLINKSSACKSLDYWWSDNIKEEGEEIKTCVGSMIYESKFNHWNDETQKLEPIEEKLQLDLTGIVKYIDYPEEIIKYRYNKLNSAQIQEIRKTLKHTMPLIMFGIKPTTSKTTTEEKPVSDYTGHMYTYLPTSLNINLPFIFQIPFILEDNRSCPKIDEENIWNNHLFDHLWGKNGKTSIIKEWYESLNEKLNVYNYLPKTFESIGIYIKESIETSESSNYAALAEKAIDNFNKKYNDAFSTLFENIKIFKVKDVEDTFVNIKEIVIPDKTIASFDDEQGKNLFWEAYRELYLENEEADIYRFEYNATQKEAEPVKNFKKLYKNSQSLILKWEYLIEKEEIKNRVKSKWNTLSKKEFSIDFLNKKHWLKDINGEIKKENLDIEIENIRKWASDLLSFDVTLFNDETKLVEYSPQNNEHIQMWIAAPEENEISRSLHWVNKDLSFQVNILIKQAFKDSILELFADNDNLEFNCKSIIDCIAMKSISEDFDIAKLYLASYYYLQNKTYYADFSVLTTLSEKISIDPDEILSYHDFSQQLTCNKNLDLITQHIQALEWARILWKSLEEKIWKELEEKICPNNFSNVASKYIEKLEDSEYSLYIFKEYLDKFGDNQAFIKFPEYMFLHDRKNVDDVYLKEKKCTKEEFEQKKDIRDHIFKNTYTRGIQKGYFSDYHLAIIKAIQYCQIKDQKSGERVATHNNVNIYHELLQNVNDYIEKGTHLALSLYKEEDSFWFTLAYKEQLCCERTNERNELVNETMRGFLPNNILSLVSIHNSTKSTKDADNGTFIGEKGIGFKHIFSFFDQVYVDSNGYHFFLDDSYVVSSELIKNYKGDAILKDTHCKFEEKIKEEKEQTEGEPSSPKTTFPIIQASSEKLDKTFYFDAKNEETEFPDTITSFKFRFINEKFFPDMEQLLETTARDSLFLHNIDSVYFKNNLEETNSDYINLKNGNELLKDFEDSEIELIFLPPGENNEAPPQEGLFYVALPTKIKVGAGVHINVPSLKTTNSRDELLTEEEKNIEITETIFGKEGKYITKFNAFALNTLAEDKKEIAYSYIPCDLYDYFIDELGSEEECLMEGYKLLRFVPCMTSDGFQMKSLSDLLPIQEEDEKTIFTLNQSMYDWFETFDPSFENFYQYAKKENVFFLKARNVTNIDGIKKQLEFRNLSKDLLSEYESEDFLEYVADFYAKKIKNSNTLKEKWKKWKKRYLENLNEQYPLDESLSIYLKNMIAVYYPNCKFEKYFYFDKDDILSVLHVENEIERIMELYQKSVPDNYKNFKGDYDYLKKELFEEYREISNRIISDDEESQIEEPNKEFESALKKCLFEEYKIKTLSNIRSEMNPIIKTNTGDEIYSVEEPTSEKFFVEVPEDFSDKSEDMDILIKWIDSKHVVSNINLSTKFRTKPLPILSPNDYTSLLAEYDDSKAYLNFIKIYLKNKFTSRSFIENILTFWKEKFDKDKDEINRSKYFSLFISLYYLNVCMGGGRIDSVSTIDFDRAYFDQETDKDLFKNDKELFQICNELSECDGTMCPLSIKIALSSQQTLSKKYKYYEKKLNFTKKQENKIKEFSSNAWRSSNDNGIDTFLNSVYLIDEKSKYVPYLRISSDINNKNKFIVFKNESDSYLENIKKLLSNEIEITVNPKVISLPDSSLLDCTKNEYTDLLSFSITKEENNPVKSNFCMYMENDKKYRISYYVGLVKAKFETVNEEDSPSCDEILLRSTSQFTKLDVITMLNTIRRDDEFEEYLKTGVDNDEDKLYIIDTSDSIDLDMYIDLLDTENVKEEYEILRSIEASRNIEPNKETNDDNEKPSTEITTCQNEICPYSINMALLFELYVRSCLKSCPEYKEKTMLRYVPNKTTLGTNAEDEIGAMKIESKANEVRSYIDGNIIPDIVLKDNESCIIYDVKYKKPVYEDDYFYYSYDRRDDRLQLLAYGYMYNTERLGHIFPATENNTDALTFTIPTYNKSFTYEMKYLSAPKGNNEEQNN